MKRTASRIGDLCDFVKGEYPTMKTEPGDYPLVVTASYRRTASTYQLEGSAVCIPLVSSTGHGDAALHRVHYQEGRFALANLLVALLPKDPTVCFPKYLYYLLNTQREQLFVPLMQGTANVSLKTQDIADVEIELPPLSEQRRIVAKIEQLASKIEEARGLKEQCVFEQRALSRSVLSGVLPKHVARAALKDLIAPDSSISYGVLVPGPDLDEGVPFVRIQDLAPKNPPDAPNKRISPEIDAQYARTRLRGGEILIGVVGSIGKVGIAPQSWAGANIARAVCRIVPGPRIDRDYLAMVLQSSDCQEYFFNVTRTLAQPTLNVKQLSEVLIPIPPLPEQRRIVAHLDDLQAKVDQLKTLQAQTAAELDALLPSILDRAFRGEL